jgi:hypothetical protein
MEIKNYAGLGHTVTFLLDYKTNIEFGCHFIGINKIQLTIRPTINGKYAFGTFPSDAGNSILQAALKDEKLRHDLYSQYLPQIHGYYSIVMFTGLVNSAEGIPTKSHHPFGRFCTADFVQWLIDTEQGVVVATPIVTNHMHMSSECFSLLRGWFFIPKGKAKVAIKDSAFIHGNEHLLNFPDFFKEFKQINPFPLNVLNGQPKEKGNF